MATATSPRPTGSAAPQITTTGRNLPSRAVIHGVEGIGKTSMASQAPGAVVLMARGETGLETLIDSGQLPETPHWPEVQEWEEALACVQWLIDEKHAYKTLVLDAANGFERLCHEHVCRRDFKNEWGKSGFSSYMSGYEVSLADWRIFLAKLDALRERRRMAILLIAHSKVSQFRNPEGADYDRYTVDLHPKTWSLTGKWADIVMFANYFTVVEKEDGRHKAYGGKQRVLYTERTASWDAKNRHGLPEQISMGASGAEAWANFVEALKTARSKV